MVTVYDHSCLISVIQNTSGVRKRFTQFPPHGMELDADEQVSVYGNIMEAVVSGEKSRGRSIKGLLDALDATDLAIISTPAPIVYDETLEVSKILGVDNGALALADPCWETSLSEA